MGNKKYEHLLNKEVEFDRQYLDEGFHAVLRYTEKGTSYEGLCFRSSKIKNVIEDSEGLTIYTLNSILYIKKI